MPREIDRRELERLMREEHAQLVEVLPTKEYADEHLPGAISLPLRELSGAAAEAHLRRDDAVVVYCNSTE
jgi:rhodanese-related sulfurtransferase